MVGVAWEWFKWAEAESANSTSAPIPLAGTQLLGTPVCRDGEMCVPPVYLGEEDVSLVENWWYLPQYHT